MHEQITLDVAFGTLLTHVSGHWRMDWWDDGNFDAFSMSSKSDSNPMVLRSFMRETRVSYSVGVDPEYSDLRFHVVVGLFDE